MKFYSYINGLVLIAACLFGCQKQPMEPYEPPMLYTIDSLPSKYVDWKYKVEDDAITGTPHSWIPELVEDRVIFSMADYSYDVTKIFAVNKDSGTLLWKSKLFPRLINGRRGKAIIENDLYFGFRNRIIKMDTNSGEVIDATSNDGLYYHQRMTNDDAGIFYSKEAGPPLDTISYLFEWAKDEHREKIIFANKTHVVYDGKAYNTSIIPPNVFKNASGDRIAYFIQRGYRKDGPASERMSMYALNLSQKVDGQYKLEWKRDTFPYNEGNINVVTEMIHYNDDLLILPGEKALHGINPKNGDIVWSTEIPGTILLTDLLLVNDELVMINNPGDMFIVNPNTGRIKATIPECGSALSNMEELNGIVYYTAGSLYAVDIAARKVLWRYKSPHRMEEPYGNFSTTGVAIDKENKRIYTADGVYAMSIKVIR